MSHTINNYVPKLSLDFEIEINWGVAAKLHQLLYSCIISFPSGIRTSQSDEIYKLALEEQPCIFIAKLAFFEFNWINDKLHADFKQWNTDYNEAVWSLES